MFSSGARPRSTGGRHPERYDLDDVKQPRKQQLTRIRAGDSYFVITWALETYRRAQYPVELPRRVRLGLAPTANILGQMPNKAAGMKPRRVDPRASHSWIRSIGSGFEHRRLRADLLTRRPSSVFTMSNNYIRGVLKAEFEFVISGHDPTGENNPRPKLLECPSRTGPTIDRLNTS
jgi:hypothetical protein